MWTQQLSYTLTAIITPGDIYQSRNSPSCHKINFSFNNLGTHLDIRDRAMGMQQAIHTKILQTFQSKMHRMISSAPWYVSNQTLHSDFDIPYVTEVFRINARLAYGVVSGCRLKQCLSLHPNTTPPQPNHNVTSTRIVPEQNNPWNNSTNKSQVSEDGCINIRKMLSTK